MIRINKTLLRKIRATAFAAALRRRNPGGEAVVVQVLTSYPSVFYVECNNERIAGPFPTNELAHVNKERIKQERNKNVNNEN